MKFEAKDLLFSEGGFKLPSIIDDEGPSYNPNVELIYDPQTYSDGQGQLSFWHELFHHQIGELPSLCFERTLSHLLTKEFAKDRFSHSSTLSALSPTKNPTIRMLKNIFEVVHRHNSAVQEAFAIQSDYHNRKKDLKEAGKNPDKYLREAINDYSQKFKQFDSFDGIETIFGQLWRSDFMWKARGIIRGFSFAPLMLPFVLPSTTNNNLDHSKITSAGAKKFVDEFKDKYRKFPYSPWKRLATLVQIAREVEKSQNTTLDHYLELIHEDWGFAHGAFRILKGPPNRLGLYLTSQDKSGTFGIDLVCPYEKPLPYFCPIDMFNKHGLNVDIEGFGDPIALEDDKESEISRCRKIKCPRDIHIRNARHLDKQDTQIPFLKMVAKEPRSIYTLVDYGERPHVNWPRRTFLLASEALKDIVFNHPDLAEKYSKVVLTEYFKIVPRPSPFTGEIIHSRSSPERLTEYVKQLKKEKSFFKEKLGLLGPQDVSPFISLDEKKGRGLVEPGNTFEIRLA